MGRWLVRLAGTKEMFDFVDEEITKLFDSNAQRRERPDPVSGSTNLAGGGGGTTKTYADLPPEAKQACENFAKKLVGPGRAYKTVEEWRKAYVARYDWS